MAGCKEVQVQAALYYRRRLESPWMVVLYVIAALLVLATPSYSASTPPGTLIAIHASVNASAGTTTASKYLVVGSPLSSVHPDPVYLAKGWDPLANGMYVSFLHADDRGLIEVLQGIQLIDGRVLVDGVPVERNVDKQ